MRLTPVLVARSQLITSIELFAFDGDAVSVQALAGNARELLEGMCRLAGKASMSELLLADHPGKPRTDIYKALNLYRNCFKHLGRTQAEREDDQITLDQFDDIKNEFLIYICIEDYLKLRRQTPVVFQIFIAWFYALHAELIRDPAIAASFKKLFPGIENMTRQQQKNVLTDVILHFQNDPDLNAHPDTEPLIVEQ